MEQHVGAYAVAHNITFGKLLDWSDTTQNDTIRLYLKPYNEDTETVYAFSDTVGVVDTDCEITAETIEETLNEFTTVHADELGTLREQVGDFEVKFGLIYVR